MANTAQADDALLSTGDLAELLGVTPRTIYRAIETGDLPYSHKAPGTRGSYVFRLSVIRPYLESRIAEWETEIADMQHRIEAARALGVR